MAETAAAEVLTFAQTSTPAPSSFARKVRPVLGRSATTRTRREDSLMCLRSDPRPGDLHPISDWPTYGAGQRAQPIQGFCRPVGRGSEHRGSTATSVTA